jgi:hypothetical protein
MSVFDYIRESTEYHRLILELTHTRNEHLISYIRVTDGAVWGFLGIACYTLFQANAKPDQNVPLFFGLFILLMLLWRYNVMQYQKSIIKGYCRIAHCEEKLGVPYGESISQHFIDILEIPDKEKPNEYEGLFYLLTVKKYHHPIHKKWNYRACGLGTIGIFFLMCILPIPDLGMPQFSIKLALLLIVLSVWIFLWRPIIGNIHTDSIMGC